MEDVEEPVNFRVLPAYRKHKRTASALRETASTCNDLADAASQDGGGQLLLAEAKTPPSNDTYSTSSSSTSLCIPPFQKTHVVTRKRKYKKVCQRVAAFLLSTLGLSMLTVAYAVAGGYLFSALESDKEVTVQTGVGEVLRWHIGALWNGTASLNVLHPVNWSIMAETILRNYTREVYLATKNGGWDGHLSHLYDVIKEERVVTSQWDLAGSLLFAITVITTIGYGHIAPRTALGRIVTMIYATFGIPLTLLTIAQVGQYMAAVFRFTYKNVVCGLGGGVCACCRRTPVTENTHVATAADHPDSDAKSCSSEDPPLSSTCNHQPVEGHDQGQSEVQCHEDECMNGGGVNSQSGDDDGQVVQLDVVKG